MAGKLTTAQTARGFISRCFEFVQRRTPGYFLRWCNVLVIRRYDLSEPPKRLWGDEFVDMWSKYEDRTGSSVTKSFTLYNAINYIIKNNIPGDFIECGVFRGGMCGRMAEILSARKTFDRNIFLFDTFSGMPPPEGIDRFYPFYGASDSSSKAAMDVYQDNDGVWWSSALRVVKNTMARSGYPADKIHYVEGMVEDTLPRFDKRDIALLRLDTDFYKSTKIELDILYDYVVPGGVIIIDDFSGFEGSRRATMEFLEERGITPLMFHDYNSGALTFIKNI